MRCPTDRTPLKLVVLLCVFAITITAAGGVLAADGDVFLK